MKLVDVWGKKREFSPYKSQIRTNASDVVKKIYYILIFAFS
jgi:hypothetical protein